MPDEEKDKKEDTQKNDLPCPGSKIRSGGQGRGLGIGQGQGPIGIPAGRSVDDLLALLMGAAPPEDAFPPIPVGGTTRISVKKVTGKTSPESEEDTDNGDSEDTSDKNDDKDDTEEKQSSWLEGFVDACMEVGLPKEAAASLLNTAAQLDMCQDENFVTGFQEELNKCAEEMDKSGGVFSTLANMPAWASVPSGILGFVGLQNLLQEARRNWRRSPEEAAILEQLSEAEDYPDLNQLVENLGLQQRMRYMQDVPAGGSYSDPLLGGGEQRGLF
jgi:hypothetical protein